MNKYDSDKIAAILQEQYDVTVTKDVGDADIIVMNTCSVREKAQEKVFSELGQWRILQEKNPNIIIAVGGCVASQEGEDIIKRAPFVNVVFGPQTLHRLPKMVAEHLQTRKPVVDVSFPENEKFDSLPIPKTDSPTAYVSIMEGCSKYCSFCIVPYTRGTEISRGFDDVLNEVAELVDNGAQEITLLGQNVNDYLGKMESGETADLALLIHTIAALPLQRIRFTTSHPAAFTDNLINAYAEEPKLCNHLHLPVQSGSNAILAAMGRGYTTEEYIERINKLKQARPDIRVSSDFIVGFPGETEEDFAKTIDLVKKIGFDTSFSFIYSQRPGTPAANISDNTPLTVKKERLAILQETLNSQARAISASMVNNVTKILITGYSKKSKNEISGRTECNRIVNLPGDRNWIGKTVDTMITEARPNSLRGRIHILEQVTQ